MTASTVQPLRALIVEESPERLSISLPAPRRYGTLLLLTCGLAAWAAIFVFSAGAIWANIPGGFMTGVILFLWFFGCLLAAAVALSAILWMTLGREIVSLDDSNLTLRREIKGCGSNQVYKRRHMENLRVTSDPFNLYEFATSLRPLGIGGGKLIFDYLSQNCQFGAGISIDEAQHICDRLRHRLDGGAAKQGE
ncbi:MAG: hypothetical protein A2091_05085 [Desulfuromonadales bacterium GWD2_61_12]|nr:MAG: hypothetical protein A2005_08880 [Desulfuromonadales bacterium GWC2_61_20]OGR33758.1 MAG: hypothetical protein A2091_05085 [Desulfuromonadales bacterium GWD2_61_12]HAD04979.1 hypothetical protein [Desulfuromonas sp.]HBT83006.1 hypothetical protein [Desulfuromonas sp.]